MDCGNEAMAALGFGDVENNHENKMFITMVKMSKHKNYENEL